MNVYCIIALYKLYVFACTVYTRAYVHTRSPQQAATIKHAPKFNEENKTLYMFKRWIIKKIWQKMHHIKEPFFIN